MMAAVASAATVTPGLIPPPPGQKVLSVRHYEAGPPLPEEGEETKGKDANGALETLSPDHCKTSSSPKEEGETTALCLLPSKVPGSDAGPELVEEEWVTRKRVELTTTRQTETRVKRQVELDEEGRVVGDSGPIVTTSTTEDTHSEEQKHTEHRAVGPDDDPLPPLEGVGETTATKALVDSAEDGSVLVREVRERKIKSREEREEVKETEDVVHLGDITDEGYLAAVIEKKDVRTAAVDAKALTSTGPRLLRQSARSHRVVDTENTEEASVATPDGRLLTETKTQHQHEEEDLEEEDDENGKSLPDEELEGEGKKHKFIRTKEEEVVSYLADGVKVAEEMKYRAENFEGEKEAGDETDAPRIRALKPRNSRGAPPASPAGGERKDALTKRPLDLDAEEETRKVETSKWLEHHFGSDSRSSREGSAGGLDDPEAPLFGGVTPGGGSYIGITMLSKPNASRQDVPIKREALNTSPLPSNNVPSTYNRVKTPEPLSQPITNGFHHEIETSEIRTRETLKTGGTGIIGRKDAIQVLPTGPGRTFRPPLGVAVPPPSTSELTHVEPLKRKKKPLPQPVWTSDVTEDEERIGWHKNGDDAKGSRPWSHDEDSRGGGSPGEDLLARPLNRISQPYRQSTLSSPSDHSWNKTEEAKISWTNGISENHVITNGDHHHLDNHLGTPSPAPPPQEGMRVARTRRKAPPIPTHTETNGVRTLDTPTPPAPLEKKHPLQKTRFADEEGDYEEEENGRHSEGYIKDDSKDKKKKKVKKKKSGSFGDSIRRLVGRLRSRSSEKKKGKEEQNKQLQQQKSSMNSNRRGSWRSSSRTPSPDEYCEPTYRRYQNAIDGDLRTSSARRSHGNHHHNHRSVGGPRGTESSPNEATSGEEYEEEEHSVGMEGKGGPVAPPRARPTAISQGHSVTQHRGVAESQHRYHHYHQQHGGGGSSRRQQVSSSRRQPSPVGRHNESSRGEERSWRGSASRRRDYAAEAASSGGGSSSRRRHTYSPERGSVPFSSTTSEGEGSRRRDSDRVPPVVATSTPMDYEKRHGYREGGNHVQRFYLGEDPFGGSIYGREREYEGVKRSSRQRHEEQKKSGLRYGATLGRPSASNANHITSSHSHSDPARAQTLPRKLRHSPPHHTNHVSTATNHTSSASVRRQLYADNHAIGGSTNLLNKRNSDLQRHTGSLINVSIVNNVTPGTTGRAPPAKPARTYRSNLSRSKSFNVHGNDDEIELRPKPKPINGEKWESNANRYRSNPQLSRIMQEESPLKSPGIISSINRSQKDIREAVKKEEVTTKFSDLIKREENHKDGWMKKDWTPKFRERTGSGDHDNGRSESVRITTVSDGPSVTRTVRNFEKRSSGDGNKGVGRLSTTYETTTTVTESISRPPSIWRPGRKSLVGSGFGDSPGNGGVVIEVRNGRL